MAKWTPEIEEEIILLIKDWLKQKGRTQADLKRSLQSESSRMPALIEVLKKDFMQGGLPKLAGRLCSIESEWASSPQTNNNIEETEDPLGQLDLLLEELRDECET